MAIRRELARSSDRTLAWAQCLGVGLAQVAFSTREPLQPSGDDPRTLLVSAISISPAERDPSARVDEHPPDVGAVAKAVHIDLASGPVAVEDRDVLRGVWRTRPRDFSGSRRVRRLPCEPIRCQLPRGCLSDEGSGIGPIRQDALHFRAVQREGPRRVVGLGMLRVELHQIGRACEARYAIRTVDRDPAVGSYSDSRDRRSHGCGGGDSAGSERERTTKSPDDRPEMVVHVLRTPGVTRKFPSARSSVLRQRRARHIPRYICGCSRVPGHQPGVISCRG